MNLCMNDVLYAISDALDCVEHEYLGATTYHARRVACLGTLTGRTLGLDDNTLLDLAACAVLHDNALTEYGLSELQHGIDLNKTPAQFRMQDHCEIGEHNVQAMPFYKRCKNVILYHHEQAGGKGPFGKKASEVPILSRLIHLGDLIDINCSMYSVTPDKYQRILDYVESGRNILFDAETANAFLSSFTPETLAAISGENVKQTLRNTLPVITNPYSPEELIRISSMFARIIDFKSEFTCHHSMGIAQKASEMGRYYGYDKEMQSKLFFAGAVHDIGKLAIPSQILEKPGKLTKEEFTIIQKHASVTYDILSQIDGLEDITRWASFHHEKLDGSGYPFGKTGNELDHNERLFACLDIYQALTEERPYKKAFSHAETMKIMNKNVEEGKLDAAITHDLDLCFRD